MDASPPAKAVRRNDRKDARPECSCGTAGAQGVCDAVSVIIILVWMVTRSPRGTWRVSWGFRQSANMQTLEDVTLSHRQGPQGPGGTVCPSVLELSQARGIGRRPSPGFLRTSLGRSRPDLGSGTRSGHGGEAGSSPGQQAEVWGESSRLCGRTFASPSAPRARPWGRPVGEHMPLPAWGGGALHNSVAASCGAGLRHRQQRLSELGYFPGTGSHLVIY